ncbi:hypothetical protein Dimus_029729, partial [Dionaea muscipula]
CKQGQVAYVHPRNYAKSNCGFQGLKSLNTQLKLWPVPSLLLQFTEAIRLSRPPPSLPFPRNPPPPPPPLNPNFLRPTRRRLQHSHSYSSRPSSLIYSPSSDFSRLWIG